MRDLKKKGHLDNGGELYTPGVLWEFCPDTEGTEDLEPSGVFHPEGSGTMEETY